MAGSFKKFQDGFGSGADVQLFVDMLQMSVHGGNADGQTFADFLARITLAKLLQNLFLALRENLVPGLTTGTLTKRFHDPAGDLAAHGGATQLDFLNGAQDVSRVGPLEQVAAGAGLKRPENALVILIDGQNKDARRRTNVLQMARAFH